MTVTRNNLNALFGLCLILTTACGTSETFLAVQRPPDLNLDSSIMSIAVLDRSMPSDEAITVLEGLITGENIGQDRRGRRGVFNSMREIMEDQERFDLKMTGHEMKGSRSGARMLPPLKHTLIDSLGKTYHADALLVLESFDSDTRNLLTDAIEITSVVATGIDPILYANNVRTGWRLYDVASGRVLDEFETFVSPEGWWAYTNRPAVAEYQEVMTGADVSAFQMAGRIVPVEIYLNRLYYKNSGASNKQMKKAHDMVRANRWDKAEAIWNEVYQSDATKKTRGRAAFNLALAYERKGHLEQALEWTEKAIFLGNDKAIGYARQISERQNVERI